MNQFLADYLQSFVKVSFTLESNGERQVIGDGEPEFTIKLNAPLDKQELLTSTSLALGEAYMRGDIEVDRDLYLSLIHI